MTARGPVAMLSDVDGTLELSGISKRLGQRLVLDDVDLTVASGECHVLVGSSGAGKSTLLKIILGLLIPDAGTVRVGGNGLGYVPQDGLLFPHLTIRDNITLVAKLNGWSKRRRRDRLDELRDLLKVDKALMKRFPGELSGGQRQRAALLRATFLDPAVLLLDEPLGALDPIGRAAVQDELANVFRRLKKAVLIVTHDLAEARFFGDRITLLDAGRVVQQGTYQDLEQRPADAFVTEFIRTQRRGTPS